MHRDLHMIHSQYKQARDAVETDNFEHSAVPTANGCRGSIQMNVQAEQCVHQIVTKSVPVKQMLSIAIAPLHLLVVAMIFTARRTGSFNDDSGESIDPEKR